MLDEKGIEKSTKIIKQLIQDGKIVKPKPLAADFFLNKGRESVQVAQRIFDLYKEENINTNRWVINISYYSMFFTATALLAKFNHKIEADAGIHRMTYHALVHYFIKEDHKLKTEIIDQYKDAVDDAEDILQLGETKIMQLVNEFNFEIEKRKIFTYELGKSAERTKAETSLNRAKNFFRELERVIV
ncbi:hypothetical protein HOK51_03950 [Candidatus Woesearchaeota archaeon]|jgi:uncharacterized protein (UPF0332 family)|nr:hypothetical protein [Candidatus Woesearchaeota archaeon]MBT6518976.1 hypothetical protein [Candidatus Woesearchaeota archaeon]MBT7368341.1 hypothetical protein [Candidatus Woesearchaeota archaeon]